MSETLPITQRAWVLRRTGKPRDVLELEETYQIPVPKNGQILIKVHAVALNREYTVLLHDLYCWLITGLQLAAGRAFPCLLYLSFTKHQPSLNLISLVLLLEGHWMGLAMSSVRRYLEFRLLRDRMECMLCFLVFAECNQLKQFYRMRAGQGALAQYTVAEPATFVAKPSNITHAEAAAFPIAGLTAYVSLVNHGGLKHGDGKRIFVNGGSGGIGSWAVQVSCEQLCPDLVQYSAYDRLQKPMELMW